MQQSQWHMEHVTSTKAMTKGFWDAIEIWIKKPHVANRRLCGTELLWQQHEVAMDADCLSCAGQIKLHAWSSDNHWSELVSKLESLNEGANRAHSIDVYVRDLLPKNLDRIPRVREVVLLG